MAGNASPAVRRVRPRAVACSGLTEARARTFVGEAQAPFTPPVRAALAALVEMRWPGVEAEIIAENAAKFRCLCDPESAEFVVDHPDYCAWFTETLFWGRVG